MTKFTNLSEIYLKITTGNFARESKTSQILLCYACLMLISWTVSVNSEIYPKITIGNFADESKTSQIHLCYCYACLMLISWTVSVNNCLSSFWLVIFLVLSIWKTWPYTLIMTCVLKTTLAESIKLLLFNNLLSVQNKYSIQNYTTLQCST